MTGHLRGDARKRMDEQRADLDKMLARLRLELLETARPKPEPDGWLKVKVRTVDILTDAFIVSLCLPGEVIRAARRRFTR